MAYSKTDIINDLRNLNIKNTDDILIHLSFKSLGALENGFETLADAIEDAVSDGTVMLPALSWANVTPENPYFDVENTPVCVGAFPEYYRKREGAVRSLHPTHSITAKGKNAVEFTKYHISDTTPVGKNSPLYKLAKAHGKIIMIGCSLLPNTSMHGVEELFVPPYLFKNEKVEYTVFDGKTEHKAMHTVHNFSRYSQRYDRISDFLSENELYKGKTGDAETFVIDAHALWEKCGNILTSEPFYYVDEN